MLEWGGTESLEHQIQIPKGAVSPDHKPQLTDSLKEMHLPGVTPPNPIRQPDMAAKYNLIKEKERYPVAPERMSKHPQQSIELGELKQLFICTPFVRVYCKPLVDDALRIKVVRGSETGPVRTLSPVQVVSFPEGKNRGQVFSLDTKRENSTQNIGEGQPQVSLCHNC